METKPRTYDEDGNIIEENTKKGLKGGQCGMLSCTMPNAYWFNKDREFHTCHWCAQDANRLREGTSVNRGLALLLALTLISVEPILRPFFNLDESIKWICVDSKPQWEVFAVSRSSVFCIP